MKRTLALILALTLALCLVPAFGEESAKVNMYGWEIPEETITFTTYAGSDNPDTVAKIEQFFNVGEEIDDDEETPLITYGTYTDEDFLNDVYMDEPAYRSMVDVLMVKKNIILVN